MKKFLTISALALLFLGFISCSKSSDPTPTPNPNITFLATLNGASEVPANPSTASGSATLTFNSTTKIFTLAVTYSGVTATAGHIHTGAVGVSGSVVFPFSSFTSPISYTSAALDATQEANLLANLDYVNIHSAAYAAGEIRGQLIKQ